MGHRRQIDGRGGYDWAGVDSTEVDHGRAIGIRVEEEYLVHRGAERTWWGTVRVALRNVYARA